MAMIAVEAAHILHNIPQENAPPRKLSPTFDEPLPSERARSTKIEGYLNYLSAAISALAVIAIFAGQLTTYLGFLSAIPLFAAIPLALGFAWTCYKHWESAGEAFKSSHRAQEISSQFDLVKEWDQQEIEVFFEANHIQVPQGEDLELLRQKSPNNPLKPLLPIIAEIHWGNFLNAKRKEEIEEIQNNRNANNQASSNQTILEKKERVATSRLLIAQYLEQLQKPTTEFRYTRNLAENALRFELISPERKGVIGTQYSKNPENWRIEYPVEQDRTFYYPTIPAHYPALTLEQLYALTPNQIRPLVFDPDAPMPEMGV